MHSTKFYSRTCATNATINTGEPKSLGNAAMKSCTHMVSAKTVTSTHTTRYLPSPLSTI